MNGVNKVIILGRIGQDPEVRYTRDGTAVSNFSLAVSERWNDKAGQRQERTEWIRCVAWGKTAEIVKEYVGKGNPLYVEGKMQTRKWEDKEGQTRYTTEVNVQNLQLLGSAGGGGGGGSRDQEGAQDQPANEPFEAGDSDVPF